MNIRITSSSAALCALAPFFSISALSAQEAVKEAPASRPAVAAAAAMVKLDHSSPAALLSSVKGRIMNGQVSALWSGVAPVHQTEVHGLLMQVVNNVDPTVYDAAMGLMGRLGPVLAKNASFFGNNPMLGGRGEPEEMATSIKNLSAVLNKVSKSSVASHAAVSKMTVADFGSMFASMGKELSVVMQDPSMADGLPDFDSISFGEAKVEGNKAMVTATNKDGDEEVIELINMDGKWYFDMSKPISEMREESKTMKKMTPQESMQIKGLLNGMVMPIVKSFEDCESQEDFDETVQKSLGMFMGMMGGGFGGR